MVFIDYCGLKIQLTESVWIEHIKSAHPEIAENDLASTLSEPDEVWVSQKRKDVELYYKKKISSSQEKNRYWLVVVKKIPTANFVSSSITKSTVVGSTLIFKKM